MSKFRKKELRRAAVVKAIERPSRASVSLPDCADDWLAERALRRRWLETESSRRSPVLLLFRRSGDWRRQSPLPLFLSLPFFALPLPFLPLPLSLDLLDLPPEGMGICWAGINRAALLRGADVQAAPTQKLAK